jgi:hypothetical protein
VGRVDAERLETRQGIPEPKYDDPQRHGPARRVN